MQLNHITSNCIANILKRSIKTFKSTNMMQRLLSKSSFINHMLILSDVSLQLFDTIFQLLYSISSINVCLLFSSHIAGFLEFNLFLLQLKSLLLNVLQLFFQLVNAILVHSILLLIEFCYLLVELTVLAYLALGWLLYFWLLFYTCIH